MRLPKHGEQLESVKTKKQAPNRSAQVVVMQYEKRADCYA